MHHSPKPNWMAEMPTWVPVYVLWRKDILGVPVACVAECIQPRHVEVQKKSYLLALLFQVSRAGDIHLPSALSLLSVDWSGFWVPRGSPWYICIKVAESKSLFSICKLCGKLLFFLTSCAFPENLSVLPAADQVSWHLKSAIPGPAA